MTCYISQPHTEAIGVNNDSLYITTSHRNARTHLAKNVFPCHNNSSQASLDTGFLQATISRCMLVQLFVSVVIDTLHIVMLSSHDIRYRPSTYSSNIFHCSAYQRYYIYKISFNV